MVKIKKTAENPLTIIIYVIFFIFLVYLAFELIRMIFGGSLGFEGLVIGLLIANLGYTFYLTGKINGHIGWHKGKNNK